MNSLDKQILRDSRKFKLNPGSVNPDALGLEISQKDNQYEAPPPPPPPPPTPSLSEALLPSIS